MAEQALPFAVLFGSMIAFLNLSRKLELVVARAAGVSVWQILTPPLVVIASIGVLSVVAYNPASTWMKERSDTIENGIFGGRSNPWGDLWLRQKSVDGQAIIHAGGKEADGVKLSHVEIFNFDDHGAFVERVEAASGELHDGYWEFHDAKVVTPGFETLPASTYLLATTLDRTGGRPGIRGAGNSVVLEASRACRADRAGGSGSDRHIALNIRSFWRGR